MTETVNHPQHYNTHPSKVECIDVVEHENFNIGNAIKYLWRRGRKPGVSVIEDLKKAKWYVEREIKRLGGVVLSMEGDDKIFELYPDDDVYIQFSPPSEPPNIYWMTGHAKNRLLDMMKSAEVDVDFGNIKVGYAVRDLSDLGLHISQKPHTGWRLITYYVVEKGERGE